jgi:hypothetical protein
VAERSAGRGRLLGAILIAGLLVAPRAVLAAGPTAGPITPAAAPLPPEVKTPPVAPPAVHADDAGPKPNLEMERLFFALPEMRQRMQRNSETAFYIGQRHVKLLLAGEFRYEDAEKWVEVYRNAIRRLKVLPVSDYLDRPQCFLELTDAIQWGHEHAIGKPWYYKKGYQAVRIVLP